MIDLLTPTRGRPQNLYRLLDSVIRTVSDVKNVNVYFYVDDDDDKTIEVMPSIKERYTELNIVFKVDKRKCLSECWNDLWKMSDGEYCMHCGDDIAFQSKNWDEIVVSIFNQFSDKIAFVYGPDGIQNQYLGTHGIVSRKATEIVGYFVPPYFRVDYNDTWLNMLYGSLGRQVYVPNFVIEHFHFSKYTMVYDKTYEEMRVHQAEAEKIWQKKQPKLRKDIELLKNHIK